MRIKYLLFLISLIGIAYTSYCAINYVDFLNSASLSNTISSIRWTTPRLSLDGNYHSCIEGIPEKITPYCSNILDKEKGTKKIKQLARHRDSMNNHELALVNLMRGGNIQRSINLLEKHLISSDESSTVWNDLAAFYLLDFQATGNWKSLDLSIISTKKSIISDPDYSRAYFNYALISEELYLNETSIELWNKFLKLEKSNSIWKSEAKSRLLKLTENRSPLPIDLAALLPKMSTKEIKVIAANKPDLVWGLLLDNSDLLALVASNLNGFCTHQQHSWGELGSELASNYGESLLTDILSWICNNELSSIEITHILDTVSAAVNDFNIDKYTNVIEQLSNLSVQKNSPMGHIIESIKGKAYFAMQEYLNADRSLQFITSSDHPILASRAYWYLSSERSRKGDAEAALEYTNAGLDLLSNGVSPNEAVRFKSMLAEALAVSGRHDAAMQKALETLSIKKGDLPAKTYAKTCKLISVVARESSTFHLQELFTNCAKNMLKLAENNLSPTFKAEVNISSAQAKAKVGDINGASKDIETAIHFANTIQDIKGREHVFRYINLNSGFDLTADPMKNNIESLKAAQRYFNENDNSRQALNAAKSVANFYIDSGSITEAKEQLEAVAKLAINIQSAADTFQYQSSAHQQSRDVYELLIKLYLDDNDSFNALLTLSRARLGKYFSESEFKNYLKSTTQNNRDEAILILAWLGDEVAAWLINSTEIIDGYRAPLPDGQQLVNLASETRLTSSTQTILNAHEALYNSLIRPITHHLHNYQHLRIIPDGIFYGVPFPILRNSELNRYLIEEINIIVSPDLKRGRAQTKLSTPLNSLAIFANPNADPQRPLIHSAQEVEDIQQALPSGSRVNIFFGATSNSTSFKKALDQFDVVHFSGHGDINLVDPLMSELLFTVNSNGTRDVLTAQDLYAFKSPMTPLVVLAACDTAAYSNRLPQALALVRPLLTNHARHVLGSIKPIPDRAYSKMMKLFYGSLAESEDPVFALRQLQIQSLAELSNHNNAYWGFLQIYQFL